MTDTNTDAERRDMLAADAQRCWQLIAEFRSWIPVAVSRELTAEELEQVRQLMERSRK